MKRNWALIFIVLFFMVVVLGCHMVEGAGKDIENVGEGIQRI